jgi:hypothetical protein
MYYTRVGIDSSPASEKKLKRSKHVALHVFPRSISPILRILVKNSKTHYGREVLP